MNYIVLDLEWNQSSTGREKEVKKLPFEIIEIGAMKVSDKGAVLGEFNEIVKPQVYREMHLYTSNLIHLQMEELEQGRKFPVVAQAFLDWCGEEEYLFCTWGNQDLLELQRNMRYYNMTPLSDRPIAFLDVQKLFALACEEPKQRRSLEYAIDYLHIKKEIPFHRAFSDACYTAEIFRELIECHQEVLKNLSYDVFCPPADRDAEVKVQFEHYFKYISRTFASKQEALRDKEVISTKCYLCHRNLRKKLPWFAVNTRHYYAVAYCEKHGYLKGKIRVNRGENGRVYIIKTTKFISQKEMEMLAAKREHVKELHRKHRKRGG